MTSQEEPKIEGTLLSWRNLESDFQKEMNTQAKMGSNRKAHPLGASNGFISTCFLIEFDWELGDRHLPKQAILKMVECDRLQSQADNLGDVDDVFSDTEFTFLRRVSKEKDFQKAVPLPQFFCGRKFGLNGLNAGYVLIEYFENIHSRHIYHIIPESGVLQIIQILAKMGAFSLRNPKFVAEFDEKLLAETMADYAHPEKLHRFLDTLLVKFPEKKSEIETLRTQTKYFYNIDDYFKRMSSTSKVNMLTHGDLWPGNILWQKRRRTEESNGEFTVKAIVDWQLTHHGTPLEDLARFLPTALSGKEYKNNRDKYLLTYWQELQKEARGLQLPWDTFDELIKQYELVLPLVIIVYTPLFVEMIDHSTNGKNLSQKDLNVYYEKIRVTLDEAASCIRKWKL
ncbi:unnamed protein product, partial [Mesorhabditis belari]|uniref:CHK kinase-like domain-containing protein n=1 Tax=Mesorhabditis belari TaxID=2138241 RepID=A0AAF3ETV7_9BILA